MKKTTLIFIIILFAWASFVSAQEQNADIKTDLLAQQDTTSANSDQMIFTGSKPNFAFLLLKTVGSLVIIFVLIFIVVYYFKKFYLGKKGSNLNSGSMDIVGTLYLAPKKTISLVKIGKRVVVLGLTENNISYLSEISLEEFEEMRQDESADTQGLFAQQFNGILNKIMKKEKV